MTVTTKALLDRVHELNQTLDSINAWRYYESSLKGAVFPVVIPTVGEGDQSVDSGDTLRATRAVRLELFAGPATQGLLAKTYAENAEVAVEDLYTLYNARTRLQLLGTDQGIVTMALLANDTGILYDEITGHFRTDLTLSVTFRRKITHT
jgi:hypothetical protein